jgi:hypothetical protein
VFGDERPHRGAWPPPFSSYYAPRMLTAGLVCHDRCAAEILCDAVHNPPRELISPGPASAWAIELQIDGFSATITTVATILSPGPLCGGRAQFAP